MARSCRLTVVTVVVLAGCGGGSGGEAPAVDVDSAIAIESGSQDSSVVPDTTVADTSVPPDTSTPPDTSILDTTKPETPGEVAMDAGPCETGLACPGVDAGTICIDPKTDLANCGACGKKCDAGLACIDAACVCATLTTLCAGKCVDTKTDRTNCGACAKVCATRESCVGSACVCPTGEISCDGKCTNTTTDGANCGACGNVCTGGQSCVASACVCPTGQTLCGGTCVDTTNDKSNCGVCGTVCPGAQVCSKGVCDLVCATGLMVCGVGSAKTCNDLSTDEKNCGACGTACPTMHSCKASVCVCTDAVLTSCALGSTRVCTDIKTDPGHCGACGNSCWGGSCTAGICAPPSCNAIKLAGPSSPSGLYRIDPDGPGPSPAFDAYCDMTTDGGGWTLLATLRTTTTFSTAAWGAWEDGWWAKDHGTPTSPSVAFSNHDMRKFKALIGASVLRATNPVNSVNRYMFGFTASDWDLWNASRTISGVNVIGPFNLTNVKISTSSGLGSPVPARSNGHWYSGVFYLGTMPGGADADDEGTAARYHVGSNLGGSHGYVGNTRADTTWNLWLQ